MIGRIPKKYAVKKTDNVHSMPLSDAYSKSISDGRKITFETECTADEEMIVFETVEKQHSDVLIHSPVKMFDKGWKN